MWQYAHEGWGATFTRAVRVVAKFRVFAPSHFRKRVRLKVVTVRVGDNWPSLASDATSALIH